MSIEQVSSKSGNTDSPNEQTNPPINIAFIHPDLGIGGAERLIVDAAMALQSTQNIKYNITIYTSHCDKSHCFEEIKNGDLKVEVLGDFLPTNFNGKFKIVFAFLRQLYLCLNLILTLKIINYNIIILDQLSYCIPLIKIFSKINTKILFYCHFPDKLLASHDSLIRSIYRKLFDSIEEFSTYASDQIVVNSNFTKSVVYNTFKSLKNQSLNVIYPCVSTDQKDFSPSTDSLNLVKSLLSDNTYFLSINRFEKKKNIQLAIESFAKYIDNTKDLKQSLVISGGYDPRISENFEYLEFLKLLCKNLNLSFEVFSNLTNNESVQKFDTPPQVLFLTSISTDLKNALIYNCDCLLYTPKNEHFGIVPLEAMRMGKLVIADNSGGPLETIVNFFDDKINCTGVTIDSDTNKWCDVLEWVKSLTDDELVKISENCKNRVNENFSFTALQNDLNKVILKLTNDKNINQSKLILQFSLMLILILSIKLLL